MNETQLRQTVLDVLAGIAPEIDVTTLRPERALRRQVDLDSVDWLNFLLALHEKLNVEIPEADYARLVTIDDVTCYLLDKMK